ncbi:DUF3578 domain-containing protein [Advenella sp. WQ 585]|uniref:DUF3578 domain-containing protein n=1 Tax=Advenella mandrilli TaxID=2800330 RepID=A0ABS1EFG2_9BURK|nr:DUF3578 domain-containing protein [Advenella mandrilli]MBK1781166.1 DUF3578 domain-containing protein [Advenella mandrilli]
MGLKEKLEKFMKAWVQATKEPFAGHALASFFRQDFKEDIETLVNNFGSGFQLKASVGAGNWANIPWLSILNPNMTSTTQEGIYPVFLFRADGSGFYLSLNQGTTNPIKKLGHKAAEEKSQKIISIVLENNPRLKNWGVQDIDLRASTDLGKSYEKSNISAKLYEVDSLPNDEVLQHDLEELLSFYNQIESIDIESKLRKEKMYISTKNKENINRMFFLSKPFLLLAGISGTGKTRFVREQAKSTGSLNETYCLIPVRPDWHEPSDLLGYISRLNGKEKYITTDVLKFIVKAWKALVDAGFELGEQISGKNGKCLVVSGKRDALSGVLPYWLCLDEMNLAPVEQYFSDYLSILETREWNWEGDSFTYLSDSLLKATTIEQVADQNQLRQELKIDDGKYDSIWELFLKYGIGIPFNLIVAGTVNMDETTHGFSRKVIDRALSFDFGEFFPNNFDDFFEPTTQNKTLYYPVISHANLDALATTHDSDGQKSIRFLKAVNEVLDNTPFKLAYRALNELLLAVVSYNPQNELELGAVWDDFLMCKVLPRIEGDFDKLGGESSILDCLIEKLGNEFRQFWELSEADPGARPDLYREKNDGSGDVIRIACRSKKKLEWMKKRLDGSGFTSFWP